MTLEVTVTAEVAGVTASALVTVEVGPEASFRWFGKPATEAGEG
jgi:hypothetical protein